MSLHHQTLGAAVKKYGPVHTSGQSEAEVKEAIAADEKDFNSDAVNEIYAAITAEVEQPEPGEAPEWVERLIASNESVIKSNESLEVLLAEIIESGPAQERSNQAVVDSNAALVDAFDQFKELSSRKVGNYIESAAVVEDFDESADYEVATGKSFRDSKDFTKEYTEGDDVTHLGVDVLKRLHAQGLVQEF
jgi:hypothetical protein